MSEAISDSQGLQTPGQILKAAREVRGLTMLQVAQKLRWSSQRVIDIEQDDYSHLSAKIYAQGYLRSYARLLELDDGLVIKSFDRLQGDFGWEKVRHPALSATPPVFRQKSRAKPHLLRWSSVAVGFVLVLMVVMWWHDQGGHSQVTASNETVLNPNVQSLQLKKLVPMKPVVAKKSNIMIRKKHKKHHKVISQVAKPNYTITPVSSDQAG